MSNVDLLMERRYNVYMPTGKYIRTERHKSILRKSVVEAGRKSADLRRGVPYTEERKEIQKAAMAKFKGIKRPKEIGDKISKALTGRKLSPEHCEKISKFFKGRQGVPMTEENKKKLSLRSCGEKSIWWKGGRTELKKQIKNLSLYKAWRTAVFERDNYTCQWCKVRGSVELSPDHIKPFSKILDEFNITTVEEAKVCGQLWDTDNGRTLCHPCHKLTDTYGWKLYNKSK